MAAIPISHATINATILHKVREVAAEPEYAWQGNTSRFMTGSDGQPVVRVAVVNFSPSLDIWQGLRNPAQVGRFPLTAADIWEHHAAASFSDVLPDGSPTILAMPETFEQALERIRRVVLISAMLVVNPEIYETYAQKIEKGDNDSFDYYARVSEEVSQIIDKAVGKTAMSLMASSRAVVPMTGLNATKIAANTRGKYHSDTFHGPCNDHWPQNSIAVMTGLLRFGVHRLPFRDETDTEGRCSRLFGKYRSIVIFDEQEPIVDGARGVGVLDAERLARLRRLNDYSVCDPEITAQRYCTYNTTASTGKSVCGKCIQACPSNALANSSPNPTGSFDRAVLDQSHRFYGDLLAFDFNTCMADRYKKAEVYPDYVCARCEAICAARGVRKTAADIGRIKDPLLM